MRLGVVLLILLFAAFGAVFGALNADRVAFDVYFTGFQLPKGAAVLAALLIGWLAGGFVIWLMRVLRLQRELRAARREVRDLRTQLALANAGDGKTADGA